MSVSRGNAHTHPWSVECIPPGPGQTSSHQGLSSPHLPKPRPPRRAGPRRHEAAKRGDGQQVAEGLEGRGRRRKEEEEADAHANTFPLSLFTSCPFLKTNLPPRKPGTTTTTNHQQPTQPTPSLLLPYSFFVLPAFPLHPTPLNPSPTHSKPLAAPTNPLPPPSSPPPPLLLLLLLLPPRGPAPFAPPQTPCPRPGPMSLVVLAASPPSTHPPTPSAWGSPALHSNR